MIVRRAGDVVPQVVKVVMDKRPKKTRAIALPFQCPVCASDIIQTEGETALRCSGALLSGSTKGSYQTLRLSQGLGH